MAWGSNGQAKTYDWAARRWGGPRVVPKRSQVGNRQELEGLQAS